MKGKVNDMKKSKTNVFRVLSVILMLVMVISAVNGNTVSAKTAKAKTDKKKNVVVLYFSATGTTKGAAQRIKKATKGKMISIKAADPYTEADLDYGDDESRVTKEHESAGSPAKSSVRPKISNLKSIKKAVKKSGCRVYRLPNLVGRGSAYRLYAGGRSKSERKNSSSVFHIHQQRAWQQCQTSKDKSKDFIENEVAERA